MKQKLSILLIVCVALLFSCEKSETNPESQTGQKFLQLIFNYSDGSFERSRIIPLRYKELSPNGQKTAGNITVDGVVTIAPGDYQTIEVKNGSKITIEGAVSAQNFNFINTHEVEVTVNSGAELGVYSSLNLNNKVTFTNKGKLYTGSVELQGAKNYLYNYGSHTVLGDLQILSGENTYQNCGSVTVSNYTNIVGDYVACECGYLVTSGLNVNGNRKVSGKGFIKVTDNANFNGYFTESPDIEFSYCDASGNQKPLDKNKIGAAKLTCEASCKPDALPLRYTDLKADAFTDKEGNLKAKISFKVTENSGLTEMKGIVSEDGKTWKQSFSEGPEAFVVGNSYSREFYLQLK